MNANTQTTIGLMLAVFCLAVLLRIGLIYRYDSHVDPNAYEFGVVAQSILEGRGLSLPAWWFRDEPGPTALVPPLYAYFLAGCLAVLPAHSAYFWIELIQALLSAAVVLPVWFVTKRIFGEPAAWLATVLVALDYFLACTPGWINYPTLHVFLLAMVVWSAYRLLDRPTAGRALLFGAVAGVATFAKGLIAAYVVLLGIWILLAGQRDGRTARLKTLALAATVSLLVLSPWIVRNWRLFDSFVPTATNFGLTFWIGNSPQATGGLCADDGKPVIAHVPDSLLTQLRGRNEAEQSRIFLADSRRWIGANPGRWFELRVKSFGYFWTEQNFWLPDSFYEANPGQARPNPALMTLTFALLAATLLGLLLTRNRWRELMPIYLLLLTYAIVYTFTHADITNRYRLPLEPWMLVIVAGGAMCLWTRLRGGQKDQSTPLATDDC